MGGNEDRASSGYDYDYIVVGSGFGGSVAALRLSQKGYKVLVLEKGKRYRTADFPRTNWNIRKWIWLPALRLFGFFRITWFSHVAVLSGVGVGGGSLAYANTLLVPKTAFFKGPSWAHLADWEEELKPFYTLASRMLGTAPSPRLEHGDQALRLLADRIGMAHRFEPAQVAVFFGEPEKTVPDPYFGGKGPDRSGCTFCGGCMVGCRYNAKNTLDKNYLHLAEREGSLIVPESEVTLVIPLGKPDGSGGYRVFTRSSTSMFSRKGEYTSRGIVFSGGVLGTVKLLLKLRASSLPRLSDRVGTGVRTNSESLMGVTTMDKEKVLSDGLAISSLLCTDEYSHLEIVRYPSGSGFMRLLGFPFVRGSTVVTRVINILIDLLVHPVRNARVFLVRDWAKRTQILLFMQTIDTTLRFTRGLFGLRTTKERGKNPTSYIPEAVSLAGEYARIMNGKTSVAFTETLFGIPTTAHILGGCVMGRNRTEGVIDRDNKVFGYENMYVWDGSVVSANPGVNSALTITALAERAMSKMPLKESL